MDPYGIAVLIWIQINIWNTDPDPHFKNQKKSAKEGKFEGFCVLTPLI